MRNDLRSLVSALAAAVFVAATPNVGAQIYKWTNDDGTTTYSNEAPADKASTADLAVIVPEAPRVEVQQSAKPAEPPKVVEIAPKPESEAPRESSVRSLLPQAVQDPCLRSSDRLCHQKHSAHYKPYVGYTPEPRVAEAPAVVPPARGASNGAAGTGTLSGGSRTNVTK